MSLVGKSYRMRRLFDQKTHTTVMFAYSHGTAAPIVLKGLSEIKKIIGEALQGGADVVFLSRGYVTYLAEVIKNFRSVGVALKISASATGNAIPNMEVLTCTPEEALYLGVDAVVALVPLAPENETEVISWMGKIGEECNRLGIPFIAEAEYPASYAPHSPTIDYGEKIEYLKRNSRLCAELGADIVKTNWTGTIETFKEVIQSLGGKAPVVVAGGSRVSDLDLLQKIEFAMEAGAVGCSVGRNIFQHSNPKEMTRAICSVVRGKLSAAEAAKELKKSVKP